MEIINLKFLYEYYIGYFFFFFGINIHFHKNNNLGQISRVFLYCKRITFFKLCWSDYFHYNQCKVEPSRIFILINLTIFLWSIVWGRVDTSFNRILPVYRICVNQCGFRSNRTKGSFATSWIKRARFQVCGNRAYRNC